MSDKVEVISPEADNCFPVTLISLDFSFQEKKKKIRNDIERTRQWEGWGRAQLWYNNKVFVSTSVSGGTSCRRRRATSFNTIWCPFFSFFSLFYPFLIHFLISLLMIHWLMIINIIIIAIIISATRINWIRLLFNLT